MEQKTSEEILRQQLQLLAERSANEASVSDLPQLTLAMVEVHQELKFYNKEISCSTKNCDSDDVSIPYQSKELELDRVTGLFEPKIEHF